VEYALIIVLVGVVSIVVMATADKAISDVYCEMITTLGGTCEGGLAEAEGDQGGDNG
jgi:hypothetical protein